ncbi:extracellular membrane associated protein with 3 EGF domains and a transmembrane domain [Cryptosporidium ryanae]|uniref:extracellular membrane associated protein with 3 EGF domains and a transmembrane domain n=1 Tax=Cryptosporidium ryanae TaxID=515981 RepID=UPI00351A3141|nr:extracellular membrane associated protein with 3 EGF domains and a transmembrane domain [Cryptosporidium ryanae]
MSFKLDSNHSENSQNLDDIYSALTQNLIENYASTLRKMDTSEIPFESFCPGDQTLNCGMNGKCVSLGVASGIKQFVCVCSDGYTGVKCDQVWDACLTAGPTTLCLNGGICKAKQESPFFSCECLPGFTGVSCEIENNVCKTNNPCQNGGKCTYVSENLPIICTCPSGYGGDYCQIVIKQGIGGAGVKLHPTQIILTWGFMILLLSSILYCTFSVVYDILSKRKYDKKKIQEEKEEKNKMAEHSE